MQDVYRARILNELKLEERLYETIIDIYRRYGAVQQMLRLRAAR